MRTVTLPYRQNSLPANYHGQQGLGLKLFGKPITLGKIVGGIINTVGRYVADFIGASVPIVGNAVATKLREQVGKWAMMAQQAIDGSFQARLLPGAALNDISPAEGAIIESWAETRLKPFIEKLILEIKAAQSLSAANKLTAINAVLNKINAVQDHYTAFKDSGLSNDAHDQQQYLLYELLKPVNDLAVAVLQQSGLVLETVQVTINPNQYSYSPLFSSTSIGMVTSENYRLKSGSTATTGGALPLPATQTGSTKGGTITLGQNNAAQTLSPGEQSLTQTGQNKVIPLPAAQEAAARKNKVAVLAVGTLIVAGLYALTRKPKKAQAATK